MSASVVQHELNYTIEELGGVDRTVVLTVKWPYKLTDEVVLLVNGIGRLPLQYVAAEKIAIAVRTHAHMFYEIRIVGDLVKYKERDGSSCMAEVVAGLQEVLNADVKAQAELDKLRLKPLPSFCDCGRKAADGEFRGEYPVCSQYPNCSEDD